MYRLQKFANSDFINPDTVRMGFIKVLPPETEFKTSYSSLPVFGSLWGRGILLDVATNPFSIVSTFSLDKALVLNLVPSGSILEGLFYWGFDSSTKTLYLDYETDGDTFLKSYAMRGIVAHELIISGIDFTS